MDRLNGTRIIKTSEGLLTLVVTGIISSLNLPDAVAAAAFL